MKVKNFGINRDRKIFTVHDTLMGVNTFAIEDFHPLELETELYEAECLHHYLVYGVRFAVWEIYNHYYIINVTERTYIEHKTLVTRDELTFILAINSLGR